MPGSSCHIAVSSGEIGSLTVANAFYLTPTLMQATGSNSQANAAPIQTPSAVVVTVSAASRGVRLPAASAGLTELVFNAGNFNVQVFPAAGDRIGVSATNASVAIPHDKGAIFFAQDDNTWRVIHGG